MQTSPLSPQEAARLLLHRRTIRQDLTAWCTEALRPLGQTPARHHRKIIDRLEALSRGEIDRLMVLAPPGSAKSTYISTLFPVWWLAQHPRSAIIAASHTAELAERFGRRVRNLIAEHSATLGYGLAADNAAAGRWETTAGGEYYAAGVMGPITGRRADLAILDDPVRSRQDADSEIIQERTWEWWRADLSTRLKPGARVVLVMTRWSEADLGGKLLDDMAAGGRPWEVLRLPMVAEAGDPLNRAPGEMLWDDWFTADMLAEAKRDARTYSALYQQNPVPDEGHFFQRSWLRPAATMPARSTLRVYGASDYAVTQDGGDYTVHVVVGVDPDRRLWLLDLWRGQASSNVWVEAFCDLVRQWKPIGWAEETGQIRAGVGPFLDAQMRQRQAYVHRTQFPTRGDKAVRAQSIRGRMALEGLHLPASAPWRADLEAELMSFPAGRHDDQVDALGLLGQLLDKMSAGERPKAPAKPVDSYDRAFRRSGGGDDVEAWRVA
jgi:predicted phage terminase large subunit-like protein